MASLATLATVASIGSAVVGAGAAVYSGYQQQQANDTTANNLETQAHAEFASSQRDAEEKQLEGQLTMSSQQAAAAASGAGAGAEAPTIVRLMTETAKRTQYASDSAEYTGEARASQYQQAANADRQGGQNSLLGGFASGIGRLVSGAGEYARGVQNGTMAGI